MPSRDSAPAALAVIIGTSYVESSSSIEQRWWSEKQAIQGFALDLLI